MRYGKLDRGVVIYATSGNPDELLAQGYLPDQTDGDPGSSEQMFKKCLERSGRKNRTVLGRGDRSDPARVRAYDC